MKTLLLLSILGLALVCAEVHAEDQYTEDADVVAVDDSAEAMDNLDDTRRSHGWQSLTAKFEFGDALTADIKVTQSNAEKKKNNAKWSAKFGKFDKDICPSGELNWHVHQYPVSETAELNMGTMTTQIENFNIQNAPIEYFTGAENLPTTVGGSAFTSITSDGALRLDWELTGLDINSSGGIHVHYGTSCQSEETVLGDAPDLALKGHYYNPADTTADPWGPVTWNSGADGASKGFVEITQAQLGATAVSAYDRVVIVHNNAKGKIGCGLLASYTPTTVTGTASTSVTSDNKLLLNWDLTGLDINSSGGIHVHYGRSCQSEATVKGDAPDAAIKGHYYNPADATADPWGPVEWNSGADGSAEATIEITKDELGGLHPGSAYNRVVVVHNNDGKKVGCGVLAISAPGCGGGVTGGHYDPTFACGGASQNNNNGICPILRATDQNPADNGLVKGAYACTETNQWACEIGDQSGKMGKLIPTQRRRKGQKYKDYWMEPIANLEGKSMVLHCCDAEGKCSARLACANLE